VVGAVMNSGDFTELRLDLMNALDAGEVDDEASIANVGEQA
jgi:hypothetical protein